jgi:hypothetical protein
MEALHSQSATQAWVIEEGEEGEEFLPELLMGEGEEAPFQTQIPLF